MIFILFSKNAIRIRSYVRKRTFRPLTFTTSRISNCGRIVDLLSYPIQGGSEVNPEIALRCQSTALKYQVFETFEGGYFGNTL